MIPVDTSSRRLSPASVARLRRGFTLIELLVTITIMLLVFGMTAGIVTLAITTDQIPSSARTIQAAVLGARDRALRAGRLDTTQQPRRGIRFVLDPNNANAISSMVYIGSVDDWTEGQVTITTTSGVSTIATPPWSSVTALNAAISNQGLNGIRIKILEGAGAWYRIFDNAGVITLSRAYSGTSGSAFNYRLQLPADVLPNEQPLALNANVVVNLTRSQFPSGWNREVLFTPNGNVYGALAAQTPVYLYLCTRDDFLNNRDPADPASGDKLIVKITPQTGQVQSFPVDLTDANTDNIADNPFKFAQQ